jgi:hypothetical protein
LRNCYKHIALFLLAGPWCFSAMAQYTHETYFRGMQEVLHAKLYEHKQKFHPDVQPYYVAEVEKCVGKDSLFQYKIPKENRFYKKVLTDNLLSIHKKKWSLAADPILNVVGGFDLSKSKGVYESGLGMKLQAGFFDKLAIGGSVLFNQSVFPYFISEKISNSRVVPGQGYAYRSSLGGYNYLNYDFYANYHFLKYFTLEAGIGKHFWGDGYRSLFLSDNAYNYPYLKLTTNVWNIKLVNLYTNFKDMSGTASSRWSDMKNKYGAFHYLSWDISKRVNLGFFESVIWEGKDTAGNRGFDISYLNPVIFLRPVEFSRGSPDNSLLGISLRVKVGKRISLYGQLLIDDIIFSEAKNGIFHRIQRLFHPGDSTLTTGYWANKQGWQLGVRSYDMFGIKNFSGLVECNWVRPYTYAHRRVTQNYGHYNEPLAHPAGANFWETSTFVWYSYRRWFFEAHFNYLVTGLDTANSNFGQDIYKPAWDVYEPEWDNVPVQQYGNEIAQGIKTRIAYYSLNVSYLLNPKNNLRFVLGYYYRSSDSNLKHDYAHVISLGIKMSMADRHFDY